MLLLCILYGSSYLCICIYIRIYVQHDYSHENWIVLDFLTDRCLAKKTKQNAWELRDILKRMYGVLYGTADCRFSHLYTRRARYDGLLLFNCLTSVYHILYISTVRKNITACERSEFWLIYYQTHCLPLVGKNNKTFDVALTTIVADADAWSELIA